MISPPVHPGWGRLLTDEVQPPFLFLALELFLASLRSRLRNGEAELDVCIAELHEFAVSHAKLAGPDLEPLFRPGASG